MQYYTPTRATAEDMAAFHAEDYVEFLQNVSPDNAVGRPVVGQVLAGRAWQRRTARQQHGCRHARGRCAASVRPRVDGNARSCVLGYPLARMHRGTGRMQLAVKSARAMAADMALMSCSCVGCTLPLGLMHFRLLLTVRAVSVQPRASGV
jgi:hypothetical protein